MKFNLIVEQEVAVVRRTSYEVESDSLEEAIKLAVSDKPRCQWSEVLEDTETNLEESIISKGSPVVQVFQNDLDHKVYEK